MLPTETVKVAHRIRGGDLRNGDRFGRPIASEDTDFHVNLQASRIALRFGVTLAVAAVIARCVYGKQRA